MDKLAKLVRQSGKSKKAVEAVLEIAQRELPASLRQPTVRVPVSIRPEVTNLVLEAIWRWWLPDARKRLRMGQWKPRELLSKLRTALCQYGHLKHLQYIRDISNLSRLGSVQVFLSGDSLPGQVTDDRSKDPEWVYSKKEARFLMRLLRNSNGRAGALGHERLRAAMRIMVLMRRRTKGMKNFSDRPWSQLFDEVGSVLSEVLG